MPDDDKKDDKGFTPITTPEQLSAFLKDRVQRAEAKVAEKFSDYDEFKQKAQKYDSLEQSKKSAEEQLTERITTLETELGTSRSEATKARIQAKYKVSDDDAELFLTAGDTEGLEKQAKALADRTADRKAKGPVVPSQKGGEDDKNLKADPLRELASRVFKNNSDE